MKCEENFLEEVKNFWMESSACLRSKKITTWFEKWPYEKDISKKCNLEEGDSQREASSKKEEKIRGGIDKIWLGI